MGHSPIPAPAPAAPPPQVSYTPQPQQQQMTRTMAQRHENAGSLVEPCTAPAHDPSPSPSTSSPSSPGHVSSSQLHSSAPTTADELGSSPPPLRTLAKLTT